MEHGTGNTAAQGTFDICGCIVNEKTLFRLQAELFKAEPVDFRLRLDHVHIRGDQFSVKEFAGGNSGPIFMLTDAGVGQ